MGYICIPFLKFVDYKMYNFKSISVVPSSTDFVDIILSKTQRKTPTVIHKGYEISRIRKFYTRKVKFTQKNIHDRLTELLDNFPRMDDIHPFYGDLMNVLYDKDHYKVALGQISAIRHIVDSIGRDYVRLLKYGDSMFRCKQVKKACLGRMAAALRKLGPTLSYLEQVRQHLARLPSIDPNAKTLLVCGFPNVGKSSFLNKVSRADVEVQPYAFTTKSLYVGHTDFNYHTWQVIDTPGILDNSLENRNVIEMQSITALAHLDACVLYFMDLSGECGYSIESQVSLFYNIQPLFSGKPLVIVLNKSDLCTLKNLDGPDKELVNKLVESIGDGGAIIETSTLIDEKVGDVKETACKMLLAHRGIPQKDGPLSVDIFCALPKKRDAVQRVATFPASVLDEILSEKQPISIITEKQLEGENGGPGVYFPDLRKHHILEKDEWKNDVVPEIMDGMNIMDFASPDIEQKLLDLEVEQEQIMRREHSDLHERRAMTRDEPQTKLALQLVESQLAIKRFETVLNRRKNQKTKQMQVAIDNFDAKVGTVNPEQKPSRKRTRGDLAAAALEAERSQARGSTIATGTTTEQKVVARGDGFIDMKQKRQAAKLMRIGARKWSNEGRKGEGDHSVPDLKPKHLFMGKMTVGKRRSR